jgi:hypothetical protein
LVKVKKAGIDIEVERVLSAGGIIAIPGYRESRRPVAAMGHESFSLLF